MPTLQTQASPRITTKQERLDRALTLRHPKVAELIAELRKGISERIDVTVERTLGEYAKIAFANMQDYVRLNYDGDAYLDLSNATREQFAAISEITTDTYLEGRGDTAREVKRTKVKLSSKQSALDSIAKHLGMFIERKHITVKSVDEMNEAELIKLVGDELPDDLVHLKTEGNA